MSMTKLAVCYYDFVCLTGHKKVSGFVQTMVIIL